MLRALVLLVLGLVQAIAWVGTVAWQTPLELASGPGERGPWHQNDSRFLYVDDGTAAFGPQGMLYTAWVDQAAKDVYFQVRDAHGGISPPPLNVSRSPASFSWLPRIATLPGQPQTVLLLWQEIIFSGGGHGGEIMLARSSDHGASFSAPINLSNSVGGDGKGRINKDIWDNGSLDIATGPDGMVHVAWTEYDGQLWHSLSPDGGISFERPRQLAGSKTLPARAPSLAVAGNGHVYLAFTHGEQAAADIMLMRSSDGGASFSAPRAVEQTASYSDAPRLAIGANGVLHLAWAESQGGPFARYRIRYARSQDAGLRFSTPVYLDGEAAGRKSASFPALAVSGQRVAVMWETHEAAGVRPRGLRMRISDDGGKHFRPAFVVPGSVDPHGASNGSVQGMLMKKLAVADDGRIAIVSSAMKPGHYSRVWLLRARM